MKRRLVATAGLLWAALAAAQPAEGPITLVVPFPPGDALDGTARAVAEAVATELKTTIVVDNKPGAAGSIAAEAVARSGSPTTFLLGTTGMMSINPFLRKTPYAPSDFVPVARMATIVSVIAVAPSFPARNWTEFVALAKASPGKYSYASPGPGTGIHMAMEAVQSAAAIKLLHVPYRGMATALPDFLGGRVDIYSEAGIINHIKAGTARGLAVVGPSRLPELPDVPSTHELKVPFDAPGWLAVFGTKGVSPALAEQLSAALRKAVANPELKTRLPVGVQASYANAATLGRQIQADQAVYRKLITDLDIKAD